MTILRISAHEFRATQTAVEDTEPVKPEFTKAYGELCYSFFTRLRAKLWTLLLSSQLGSCGKRSVICPPIRFANLRHVFLEDGVTIHRDCWIMTLPLPESSESPRLVVRSHASIGMGSTISAAKQVVLGEYVLLARNVYISDHGHAFEDINIPIALQGLRGLAPVQIGAHAWIGQNACILPGVTIGKHCVVGANSVVTHSIPDFSVAVGAPARVIKRYDAGTQRWEKVAQPE